MLNVCICKTTNCICLSIDPKLQGGKYFKNESSYSFSQNTAVLIKTYIPHDHQHSGTRCSYHHILRGSQLCMEGDSYEMNEGTRVQIRTQPGEEEGIVQRRTVAQGVDSLMLTGDMHNMLGCRTMFEF